MELEKFQFQGTFDKIHFIAPLGTKQDIKIIIHTTHLQSVFKFQNKKIEEEQAAARSISLISPSASFLVM